jgi:hypothetical protein
MELFCAGAKICKPSVERYGREVAIRGPGDRSIVMQFHSVGRSRVRERIGIPAAWTHVPVKTYFETPTEHLGAVVLAELPVPGTALEA